MSNGGAQIVIRVPAKLPYTEAATFTDLVSMQILAGIETGIFLRT